METTNRIKTILTNFQLPKIDFSSYSILDDENEDFRAAMKIICNRYQYEKIRRESLFNAYRELHSTFSTVLAQCHKVLNDPIKDPKIVEPIVGQVPEDCCEDIKFDDSDDNDILMADLTTNIDQEENLVKNLQSPLSNVCKNLSKISDTDEDTTKNLLEADSTPKTELKKGRRSEQSHGNDENKSSLANATSSSKYHQKSPTSVPEIPSTKKPNITANVVLSNSYRINSVKKSSKKLLKQKTLVLKANPVKADVTLVDKKDGNVDASQIRNSTLFDESYVDRKTLGCPTNDEANERSEIEKRKIQAESESKMDKSLSVESPTDNNDQETQKLMPGEDAITLSQINDTARSLFDDDDLDGFDESQALHNTRLASSDELLMTTNDNVENNKDKAIDASKCSQWDETFFAPAELRAKTTADTRITELNLVAGSSGITKISGNVNNFRPLKFLSIKRKSQVEPVADSQKDVGSEDFGIQDIDWDTDISTDTWPQPKRIITDSFNRLPKKKNKSSSFAYKGKVERNKMVRNKLQGWGCRECENYYGDIGLNENELKKRKDACSRHRSKFDERYYTPKSFWDPHFKDMDSSFDESDGDAPSHKKP